ncbi:MAG TPA: PilZ domain-containing protein [Nitrospira sp.]|nr:PilZ domain-containing protein [Nitrospira sp.]
MVTRKSCRYPVEYSGSFAGDGIAAHGIILDLSSEGCRARSEMAFAKGNFLRVLIDVPRYEKPLHVLLAVIRWSKGDEFGMEFIQMEPEDQKRLRELIKASAAALSNERAVGTQSEESP